MIEHDGCVGCKYEHEDEASPHCDKCTQNSTDKYMPVSNADRIRGMTDGELQKFLHEFESGDVDYAKTFCDLCCKDAALERRSVDCEGCLLWWLKNDAKQPQGLDYWTKQPAETEGEGHD